MGRNGGGRGGQFSNQLRKRIEKCEIKSPTIDQLVAFLHSTYYGSLSVRQLTRLVRDALQFIDSRKSKTILTDEYSEEEEATNNEETPPRKKIKKFDLSEEKLKQLEAQHLKEYRASDNSSASNVVDSSSSSGSIYIDDEDELSTAEDRVVDRGEFDLMKEMLRQNYIQKAKNNVKEKAKENALEMEMDNKVNKKLNLLNDRDGRRRKVELNSSKRGGVSTSGDGDVGKSTGPMFKDMGGLNDVINNLLEEVFVPLYHPHLVQPMSGILLYGPPGCGKTTLAHAIANEANEAIGAKVHFYQKSATEFVSGNPGASEESILEVFDKAKRTAPSIIFIDEIDLIASKREKAQRDVDRSIVTQFMACMDDLTRHIQPPNDKNENPESCDSKPGHVLVIGATNRINAIDPALRRPGRFYPEIPLSLPDETARVDILSKLTHKLKNVDGAIDLVKIARLTSGFAGAELDALTKKADKLALMRVFNQRKPALSEQPINWEYAKELLRKPLSHEEMERLSIKMNDFEEAAKLVQPSLGKERFSRIPDVKWEDVGGLDMLREEFNQDIVQRIRTPDLYADFGINLETGFLLYGPPGCGKTLIAKALATEVNLQFIHVKGPEILNKYVGESELAIRDIFDNARKRSPCVLFFDEIDALTKKRGSEGGWVVEGPLNQLLVELDGGENRKDVFVIAATNRPEIIDQALLRPGRFGKLVYVCLPTPDERGLILKAICRNKPIDPSVDLMDIAKHKACDNLSGADLAALVNNAAMAAVKEIQTLGDTKDGAPRTIKLSHFKLALEKAAPSVSKEQRLHYERLSEKLQANRS